MATRKDPQGIGLRRYGNLHRKKWPLRDGWVIGATVPANSDLARPIHEWDLQWTVTKGSRTKKKNGVSRKGRRITSKGTYCGPDELGAVFKTAHEAYLLYCEFSGATLKSDEMPPKYNPPVSEFGPQIVDVSALIEEMTVRIDPDPVGLMVPPAPVVTPPVTPPVVTDPAVAPLRNRAQELIHAYTLMKQDLDALEKELNSFSVVFNSTRELRSTREAQLLALVVAGKLNSELQEKLKAPKRDTYCFEHEGTKISLVGASFRCTSCRLVKTGSAFGMRRMPDGDFRSQAQCSQCRSVREHSPLGLVADS